jgi:hypothetical protein
MVRALWFVRFMVRAMVRALRMFLLFSGFAELSPYFDRGVAGLLWQACSLEKQGTRASQCGLIAAPGSIFLA